MFILDALEFQARSRPHEPAIIHERRLVTYGQLEALVLATAGRLRALDLDPEGTVAVYVGDPILHLLIVLALMREAVPSFSAHPNHDPPPGGLVPAAYIADRALPHMEGTPTVLVDGGWLKAIVGAPAPEPRRFPGEAALLRVFASSGTTGMPKAVPVTLAMARARIAADLAVGMYRGERFLPVVAGSTSFGLRRRLAGLMLGQTLILAANSAETAIAAERFAASELRLSVAQLQGLLDAMGRAPRRFPALEHVAVSGAALAPAMAVAARAQLGAAITGVYGATEAGTMAVAPGPVLARVAGAAGFPLPSVAVEIVDADGRPLPRGREGIVRVRTPGMAERYLGDPAASETAFRDGWFHPGDIGVLHEGGLLVIVGRAAELINAGGVKTSPELVNRFLLAQPGIAEAAAFGVERPGRAAEIWAAVVAARPVDETALLAAARQALNSRAPVRIVRVESLPRNTMGKVVLDELRRRVAAVGGAGSPSVPGPR